MSDVSAVLTEERDEARQTLEEREFGFWLFLMSDAIIFALLFATYAVMAENRADGPAGAELFNLARTLGETALLLTSSVAFGFASVALAVRRKSLAVLWLIVTALLGLGFLIMEIGDFRAMIAQGAGPQRSGFLSAFFTLTGTHGLHVFMGLVWMFILAIQLLIRGLTAPAVSRLTRLGLFWHFLDIVWIGIYSIVFLPGML